MLSHRVLVQTPILALPTSLEGWGNSHRLGIAAKGLPLTGLGRQSQQRRLKSHQSPTTALPGVLFLTNLLGPNKPGANAGLKPHNDARNQSATFRWKISFEKAHTPEFSVAQSFPPLDKLRACRARFNVFEQGTTKFNNFASHDGQCTTGKGDPGCAKRSSTRPKRKCRTNGAAGRPSGPAPADSL
jgi:hypothetical protein